MKQNPKNCRNNCPFHQTAECPAIELEQKEHVHGFSRIVEATTPIVGCATYPESALISDTIGQVPIDTDIPPKQPAAGKKKK